jgi:hypothetical protein
VKHDVKRQETGEAQREICEAHVSVFDRERESDTLRFALSQFIVAHITMTYSIVV